MEIDNKNMLFIIIYDVELKNNISNLLTVSYNIEGGFDAHYDPSIYNYYYISSPAKNWSEFKEMIINIKTNENNPYVIKASLDFQKVNDNLYTIKLNQVPDKNLSFSLCASENPQYHKGSYIERVIWIIIIAIILGLVL